MTIMLNSRDLEQISNLGIDISKIEQQLENYRKGFPFVNLVKPALVKDGIKVFENTEINRFIELFTTKSASREILKFVPASGAASRMFKILYSFREKYKKTDKDIQQFESDKSFNSVYRFITDIKKFAFYDDLKKVLDKNNIDIEKCLNDKDYVPIIDYLLDDYGLGYGSLPKGLLKFHKYEGHSRTSIEEHLVEAANYATDNQKNASVHFTLSPEHISKFENHINQVANYYENIFNVKFKITHSIQKPSTDTISVDMDNNIFRNDDGSILFRPGGHGALIENLNDLKGDIIFIKNIDNVVPDKYKEQTYNYKKAIGGYLIYLQEKIFKYIENLESNPDDGMLDEIIDFAINELMIRFNDNFETLPRSKKIEYLFNKLNRPIRVCGMVKNEGEPGGGPFWVKNSNDEISLQIIESSQINMDNSVQNQIFNSSTHFNPVDLVCGLRNYKGENFDLLKYIDPSTGFISIKSKDGRNLKAQELPGLWNGAMADWLTIFVEVPIITFNPVKVINDLLRIEHQ